MLDDWLRSAKVLAQNARHIQSYDQQLSIKLAATADAIKAHVAMIKSRQLAINLQKQDDADSDTEELVVGLLKKSGL